MSYIIEVNPATARRQLILRPAFPTVVCICGSTRFVEAWKQAHRAESLAGRIVLSVGVAIHMGDSPIREDSPDKRLLDELHFRKIELCDEVLILNVGQYIGPSTGRELAYAICLGKPIRTLEQMDVVNWYKKREPESPLIAPGVGCYAAR